jgi:hypothetical protein
MDQVGVQLSLSQLKRDRASQSHKQRLIEGAFETVPESEFECIRDNQRRRPDYEHDEIRRVDPDQWFEYIECSLGCPDQQWEPEDDAYCAEQHCPQGNFGRKETSDSSEYEPYTCHYPRADVTLASG